MADPGSAAAFDPSNAPAGTAAAAPPSTAVTQLIDAYRKHGHRRARLDPLARAPLPDVPELRLRFHGLDERRAHLFQDIEEFRFFRGIHQGQAGNVP